MTQSPQLTPAQSAMAKDWAQLRKAEFGNPVELSLRYALIFAGSVTLYLYTGLWHGPAWGLAYVASQLVTLLVLSRVVPPYRRIDFVWATIGYLLSSIIFLVMPIGLFLFGDGPLMFAGGMVLAALCVFSLWREEPPAVLLPFDLVLAWVVAGFVLWAAYPLGEGALAKGIVVVLTLTAVVYYSLAVITTARNRQSLREAAQRGIEAQKMEAIGRLSGGIAHDFNNILTVLQGNLELYEEITDPDERARLVKEAHQASRRAAGLVSQLLAFARRAPLAPRDVSVEALIEDLVALSNRLLPATVSVFPVVPSTALAVRADPDQLISALLNLVLNARDAMPETGEITIAATPVTIAVATPSLSISPGRYVKFTIGDTGHGMEADILDRAVEPFFSTKPVGAGSGLGLPTAKGFAEQSGGALTIRSSDKGTEVSIYLPRASIQPEAATKT